MKKWEYSVVSGKAGGVEYKIEIRMSDIHKERQYVTMESMLNEVGALGWELVTLQHISKSQGFLTTFKREVV